MHSNNLLRSLTSRIMLIGVMIFLLLFLPSNSELNDIAVTANKAGDSALEQIKLLQDGIEDFQQTDIQTSIDNAGLQAKTVAELLKGQTIDIETVQTLHDAFGDLAVGLETTGEFIDPENAIALATSLENTATFLETSVATNALEIAGQVEKVAQSFSSNAKRLNQFLETEPFDLKAIEQLRDTLNSYSKAINSINQYQLSTNDFNAIAKSLEEVSRQVDYYATYKVLGFGVVSDDTKTASRNAAKSLRVIAEKTKQLGKQLPQIKAAVSDSKKTIDAAKLMLDNTLEQRDAIEPILSDLPMQFAFLSQEFPKLMLNFTSLLRETSKINQAAAVLRETAKRTRKAGEELPKIQSAISRGARLLTNSQKQLNHVINNREKYDAALGQTVVTLEGLSVAIPATKSQIDQRLQEQEIILDSFAVTAKQTNSMIAAYQASLSNRLNLIRMLLYTAIVITLGSCAMCFRSASTVEPSPS